MDPGPYEAVQWTASPGPRGRLAGARRDRPLDGPVLPRAMPSAPCSRPLGALKRAPGYPRSVRRVAIVVNPISGSASRSRALAECRRFERMHQEKFEEFQRPKRRREQPQARIFRIWAGSAAASSF